MGSPGSQSLGPSVVPGNHTSVATSELFVGHTLRHTSLGALSTSRWQDPVGSRLGRESDRGNTVQSPGVIGLGVVGCSAVGNPG